MASVFTYDPDPPRVSSPWLGPVDLNNQTPKRSPLPSSAPSLPGFLSDYGVTRLVAEPQEGPTEYKLHLLLRPRRAYKAMSTTTISSKAESKNARIALQSTILSKQPRQERLQHLTTQLLWRLQQSSPYHASSSKELTIPKLPDDSVDLYQFTQPSILVPGLEESRGALYEVGVSDDGTLVGLTKDEMDESINTLRVMAASLGCSVEIVRMIIVGDCEWIELVEYVDNGASVTAQESKSGRLWVAEALVTPDLGLRTDHSSAAVPRVEGSSDLSRQTGTAEFSSAPSRGSSTTPQLRITLTGPTTSGKSSLLGTLSSGILDNGRGKSRLSLLKHRHEMVSGVTSSIAQELIGYKDVEVQNFCHGNIESWTDIHDCSESGKLVFVTDSGGHPRYRRTVLRGLMNWAPHWSILCIAADDAEESSKNHAGISPAPSFLELSPTRADFVIAHLTLSLKLEVPVAIVITKLDLASKNSFKHTMAKILTAIKEAGRVPKILQSGQAQQDIISQIPVEDLNKVQSVIDLMIESKNMMKYVPIVLTSSVKGVGIGLVHALLQALPVPPKPSAYDLVGDALNPEQPKCLFHIDDIFNLPVAHGLSARRDDQHGDEGLIVSGHMRFGNLSVTEEIVVGPFPAEDDEPRGTVPEDRAFSGGHGLSISHPSSAELARIAMKNAVSASSIAGEWHTAHIVSIRNLRLPVRTLEAGQAGSIGLVFQRSEKGNMPRVRRGMILAIPSKHMIDSKLSLQAASGFTASFSDPEIGSITIGSLVNVYFASVRAAARIVHIAHRECPELTGKDETDEIFGLNDDLEDTAVGEPSSRLGASNVEVSLDLLHSREWIELGSKVILMEGGSRDRSGLEGFVGKIVEIVD